MILLSIGASSAVGFAAALRAEHAIDCQESSCIAALPEAYLAGAGC